MMSISRIRRFFVEDLWTAGAGGPSLARRAVVDCVRVVVIAYEGFVSDLCLLRASALTYASLMALVPVLAVSFAFLRGLGWSGERLEAVILGKMTILSPEAIKTAVSYIDHTNIAGLGLLGGAFLILTFVSVMSNIEQSLNAIWGSPRPRGWLRRMTDYTSVMVGAPLVLALAASLTAAVRSNSAVQWLTSMWGVGLAVQTAMSLAAYALVALLFTFLYSFLPNTRVRVMPALIGGVVAGVTWQLTQIAYLGFQFGMAKYNAIYGAMAQLPILMLWIYVSWVIVLLGAEISSAVQNLGVLSHERRTTQAGFALREYLGLAVVAELAAAAHARRAVPTLEDLARSLDVPIRMVHELVLELSAAGLVHLGGEERELCFLSLAPSRIPLLRVLEVVRGEAAPGPAPGGAGAIARAEAAAVEYAAADAAPEHGAADAQPPGNPAVARFTTALAEGRREALGEATVADLVV